MTDNKMNIGLLFGGPSSEHEISLISAASVYKALDQSKYHIFLIGIDPHGKWGLFTQDIFDNIHNNKRVPSIKPSQHVTLLPGGDNRSLINPHTGEVITQLNMILPILHGQYGEDGKVQGLLELCNMPFLGADTLSSAICMDKDISKRLFVAEGIATADWLCVYDDQLSDELLTEVTTRIKYPCFVKPANTGSSVGIHKVKQENQLQAALSEAFSYDKKVLIEEFIPGREIEYAVLQKGNAPPDVSVPSEIHPGAEFYDYAAKYDPNSEAHFTIPALVEPNIIAQMQAISRTVFTALGLRHLARVDFFLTADNRIILNEINTLPGFTEISQFPKLWQASGIEYSQLLDSLITAVLLTKD